MLEDYRHQHRHQTHNLHCSVQYEYRALYGTDTGIRNVEMFFDKGPPLHNTIEIWPFCLDPGGMRSELKAHLFCFLSSVKFRADLWVFCMREGRYTPKCLFDSETLNKGLF